MSEMKKKLLSILGIAGLLTVAPVTAQETYNRWSIDIDGGAVKPFTRFSPGYRAGHVSLYHVGINGRVMLNPYFGLKFGYALNDFHNNSKSKEFHTMAHFVGGEAILNLGRIAKFEEFSSKVGLLAHAGPSLGFYSGTGEVFTGKDNVGLLSLGITPMIKLSEKISLNIDLSYYFIMKQTFNWDMQAKNTTQVGFNSSMATGSIGVSIYLGKNEKHMDWRFESNDDNAALDSLREVLETAQSEIEDMSESLDKLKKKMNDDDQDGVANYLDEEPNTPEGTQVDTKGRTVQMPEFKNLMGDPSVGDKLFYTVQLGVFSRTMPENFWKNISPIYTLNIEDGTKRYFTGIFHSVEDATEAFEKAKATGINDAFITAYYQGKRITIAEADVIRESKGASILREKP